GEPAAWVIVDAVSRYIPHVVGKRESVEEDSFQRGVFDHPHYTRPRNFRGMKVPEVLFSGDHKRIEAWRRKKALEKTRAIRPDLYNDLNSEKRGNNDESD
ncbi:MAG: tRNA (guanosine(37)-N1)-methyltransferase TrmD, partial [Candidatus Aminicenantes bacterium]|nr:tRNA (guanosine(37)-N1)-methyltransferase TrmD [Candidatus Aminicenantes bacterium]